MALEAEGTQKGGFCSLPDWDLPCISSGSWPLFCWFSGSSASPSAGRGSGEGTLLPLGLGRRAFKRNGARGGVLMPELAQDDDKPPPEEIPAQRRYRINRVCRVPTTRRRPRRHLQSRWETTSAVSGSTDPASRVLHFASGTWVATRSGRCST
jgi:hypothetical protein